MLAHGGYVFGIEDERTSELVAFARVLTDRTYKALIFDVIVAPSLGHPGLAQVRHFELSCLPEMAPFYEQWGFTTEVVGVQLMRLDAL